MGLQRLASGNFFCPNCDERYVADDVPADELICPECGNPLVEDIGEDQDEAEGEGEDEDGDAE